jgi:hypothetical protein
MKWDMGYGRWEMGGERLKTKVYRLEGLRIRMK